MNYNHKQLGRITWLMLPLVMLIALPLLVIGLGDGKPAALAAATGAIMVGIIIAYCFATLRVRDAGAYLLVRFGPIPLFSTRIMYADITGVEPARISVLTCCGIHWGPHGEWVYAVWGFDAVRVRLGRKSVCIGTDDVPGLMKFLQGKISS